MNYQIVGFSRQIYILLWKNLKLTLRNYAGLFVEVFCPLLFFAILIVMRNYVDKFDNKDQVNYLNDTVDAMPIFIRRTRVLYYPDNLFVRAIIENAVEFIQLRQPFFNPRIIGMNSSDCKTLDSIMQLRLIAFIIFPDNYTSSAALPNDVKYSMCTQEDPVYQYNIDSTFPNRTDYLYNRSPEDICFDTTYFDMYTSFIPIKYAIDLSITQLQTGTVLNYSDILQLQSFSCPGYRQDDLISTFFFLLPIVISVTYLFTSIITIGNIIVDKESKMKEYLKLIGIKWYTIWISWLIRSLGIFFILSIVISGLSVAQLPPNRKNDTVFAKKAIFEVTNYGVILLTLLVYSLQLSLFILLIAQFFNRPFLAKVCTILMWILTSVSFYNDISSNVKYIFCIFPNVGLIFALQVLFQYERSGKLFSIYDLYNNLYQDELNLGQVLTIMFCFSLLYLPFTWYFERIWPGDYGIPLPAYFPFMPSYWYNFRKISKTTGFKPKEILARDGFEKEPLNLIATVCLDNIGKSFQSACKKKDVLSKLSINCYKNQITTLLGSNGAGKSTTMFILCGLYPPSNGIATILGFDVASQMDKIRSFIGFCPQHDIVYENLSVREHLMLLAMIKGYFGTDLDAEVLRVVRVIGLELDLDTLSKKLSGGMRRRLSVGMALVGDSKIIIMDEPSSSLDPFSRRALWETIKSYKKDRTIILTTHFMEEADALSDRIGIIDDGKIQYCGSPIFLKNMYGEGYRLTISKRDDFNENQLKQLLSAEIRDFKIETNIASEMSIGIPITAVNCLPDVLAKIEQQSQNIGINSYGISSSTIEEVFLKIKRMSQNNAQSFEAIDENYDSHLLNAFSETIVPKAGFKLFFQQLYYLLKKRFTLFHRRFILALITLLVPILIEGIGSYLIPSQSYLIDTLGGTVQKYGVHKFDLSNYNPQLIPYSIVGTGDIDAIEKLVRQFVNPEKTPKAFLKPILNYSLDNEIDKFVFDKRKENLNNLIGDYFIGFSVNISKSNEIRLSGYYSTMAYHSIGAVTSLLDNILLAFMNSQSLNKSITTFNTPLPANSTRYRGNRFLRYLACFDVLPLSLLNLLTAINIGFFISLLVMHTAKERINGFKTLQLLSGTHKITYWFSNYIFDYSICVLNISLLVGVLKLVGYYQNDPTSELYAITQHPTLGYVTLLLFISSLTWPTLAHIWSFLFKSDVTSFVILAIILGIAPFLDVVLSFVLMFLNTNLDDPTVKAPGSDVLDALRTIIFLLFPNVTVKKGIYNLKIRNNSYCVESINSILKTELKMDEPYLSFNAPGIGLLLFFSAIQVLVGNLVLVMIETKFFHIMRLRKRFIKCRACHVEDCYKNEKFEEDVQNEYDRIKNADIRELTKNEPIIVNNLYKEFKKRKKPFVAVNRLSFGISSYQCFGLLGLNGAGKSTTFKILTGELESTGGTAFLNGHDINQNRFVAQKNFGFCPQNDYIPEFLNVTECLHLFARLKGLDYATARKSIDDIMKLFKLNEHKSKLVKDLSGGNRRKVSVAIAFLGRPNVIFLDEPSNGWDAVSKRYLWSIINKAKELGLCIVLTSHSMEECEALCTKLAIMVNGQFNCLGSIQYLKNKYGKGYSLIIKCHQTENIEETTGKIKAFIQENIKTSVLKDHQQETLFYQILNDDQVSIANLFNLIEQHKQQLNIETYSISQTTLEQVFLSFASKQRNDKNDTGSTSTCETNLQSSTSQSSNIQEFPIFSTFDPSELENTRNLRRKIESKKFRMFKAKLNLNI